MADIQQWRRMIQPARSRTPVVEYEEADAYLSPTTPRKRLKPKVSSYFTQHTNNAGPGKKANPSLRDDFGGLDFPTWPAEDPYPCPDADVLLDSVMCRILNSPYEALHPRYNGILLQIFEGFRNLADEKQRLQAKADQDSDRVAAMERAMQTSAHQWNRERQEYQAEVKRLEVLLSRGENGLAEVTFARQDSLLRSRDAVNRSKARKHDTLETIFQFIEKSKRDQDKNWSSQRATMRTRSPSAKMRRLSEKLTAEGTACPDLPPGSVTEGLSTLTEARYLEEKMHAAGCGSLDKSPRTISNPKTSFSEDDTTSAVSATGDLLLEGTDSDLTALKRIIQVLARRQNVDADAIMPKLLQLFTAPGLDTDSTGPPAHVRSPSAMASNIPPPVRKNTKLMAKASEFFHRLRPQLNVDTAVVEGRKFSFEAGDDSAVDARWLSGTPKALSSSVLPSAGALERTLRKCVSTPLLAERAVAKEAGGREMVLSSVEQSPTSSTPATESRRISKIPTPVRNPCVLARPRQERDNSEASLLTAIKRSVDMDRRSNSVDSSGCSSPTASHMDLILESRNKTSNRLLEHTQALRGNAFAVAAATKAAGSMQKADQATPTMHAKRTSAQSADLREHQKENARPMNAPDRVVDRKDWR